MSKKKKIFILVSMVLLLVVTGYLNVALNKRESGLEATSSAANFFVSARADKVAARNAQLEIYDKVIATSADPQEVAHAQEMRDKIAARIDEELSIETQIAARGYEEVLVKTGEDDMSVYVKAPNGLTFDEVSAILAILTRESGLLATNIRVMPMP